MRKNLLHLSILLLFGAAALSNLVFGWQAPAPATTSFPEKLLDGTPDFNLAILLQGDARGNVGPCG
jgi:hypothetical protein